MLNILALPSFGLLAAKGKIIMRQNYYHVLYRRSPYNIEISDTKEITMGKWHHGYDEPFPSKLFKTIEQ